MRALQQHANIFRYKLFTLVVIAALPDHESNCVGVVGKAIIDDGASVNVISCATVNTLKLEIAPNKSYVRLANGKRIKTNGVVSLSIIA